MLHTIAYFFQYHLSAVFQISFFQKIGPGWVLYNLAGLYWRIIGNNYHGIECIRRSLHLVPAEYKDVPLTNLANILFKWGRYEDAVKVMQDAIMIGELEVNMYIGFLMPLSLDVGIMVCVCLSICCPSALCGQDTD